MSSNASTTPDADLFTAPDSPGALLPSALHYSTPSKTLTSQLIRQSQQRVLYHLLPLLMSTLQYVCEHTANRDAFEAVLSAFRFSILQDRVLKQRFLLHAAHPSFNAFWRVVEWQRDDRAYPTPRHAQVDVKEDEHHARRGIKLTSHNEVEPEAFLESFEDQMDGHRQTERATLVLNVITADKRDKDKKYIKQVQLHLPVDDVDQQSKTVWLSSVYVRDVEEEYLFPTYNICNPISSDDSCHLSASVGEPVVVHKVFSSIAQLKIVHVRTVDGEAVERHMLVKSGDNLMQGLGVMHVSQLLNYFLWGHDEIIAQQYDRPPLAIWFRCNPNWHRCRNYAGCLGIKKFEGFWLEILEQACKRYTCWTEFNWN